MSNRQSFVTAAASSGSMREMIEKFGLRAAGGNYKQLRKWALVHGVSLPIADPMQYTANINKLRRRSDDEIFAFGSNVHRNTLKSKLLFVKDCCWLCGQSRVWNGRPLTLQIDHINGIWNDNRKENLRLLCPNCHSQTDTFANKRRIIGS